MGWFLDWSDGTAMCDAGGGLVSDADWRLARPSNAPYLWGADGTLEQRLPSGFGSSTNLEAFECPYENQGAFRGECSGETTASSDLEHLVFSSRAASFAENSEGHQPPTPGLTQAPGSAYDNSIEAGTTRLISVLPNGDDIPQDPAYKVLPRTSTQQNGPIPGGAEEFLRFPAVSADGSHILMSTATEASPYCRKDERGPCPSYLEDPLHLYMRLDDAVTFEIANGAAVNFVDMTPDGSRVYFTSAQQLLPQDHDTSVDLYMWSAEKAEHQEEPLTLLSTGTNANAGNTDACSATWIKKCGVQPYSDYAYSWLPLRGGNGSSDTSVAPDNGDIYFYSPERLDGNLGVLGDYNLYDFREGRPHFVAAFPDVHACGPENVGREVEDICSEGPIARLQVSPNDAHASFLTGARLTPYDNAGHLEMYSYTTATGNLVCDSCRPDGKSPTSDAAASQDGLFMTNDGRTFFSTKEPLVPQDTNEAVDVYEYALGRPQLITLGTGVGGPTTKFDVFGNPPPPSQAGLVGVSADGTDVYLATYDSLVPEDHNGNFLRFYDARTNGGFPIAPPRQPCAAAEECHGPGTEAPVLPTSGTTAGLTGGNVSEKVHPARHGRHKRSGHPRHHGVTHRKVGGGK